MEHSDLAINGFRVLERQPIWGLSVDLKAVSLAAQTQTISEGTDPVEQWYLTQLSDSPHQAQETAVSARAGCCSADV